MIIQSETVVPVELLSVITRHLSSQPEELSESERAVLLTSCPDAPEIAARVVELLFARGGKSKPIDDLPDYLRDVLQLKPSDIDQVITRLLHYHTRLFTPTNQGSATIVIADEVVDRILADPTVKISIQIRSLLHAAGHSPRLAAAKLAADVARKGVNAVNLQQIVDSIDRFEYAIALELLPQI